MTNRGDRDFFDRKRANPGFKRLTGANLKKRSRCANCGEKGHWAESRRNPCRSKQDRLASGKDRQKPAGPCTTGASYFFENSSSASPSRFNFADFSGAGDLGQDPRAERRARLIEY